MNDRLVDDIIKFLVAAAVTATFIYVIISGDTIVTEQIAGPAVSADKFQLLSVVGPLFGMVLGYYFMKDKR